MRIVLDALGSDRAPGVDIEGAVRAARAFGREIVLVGPEEVIRTELARHDAEGLPLSVVHASEAIEMREHPSRAVRAKPDSSIVVGMRLLREGQADAFVSAGNSGGVLAASLASVGRVGRIPGVLRPALSTVFPTLQGVSLLLDIGANTDCKPEWLVQFALMGSIYAQRVLGIARPRVGLLANGEEETKGNAAVQAAHEALRGMTLNFVGNVEAKDLLQGAADVVVSDGFVGNVAIKTAEGVAAMLFTLLRSEIKARPLAALGGLLAKPSFRAVAKRLDYREYGGAPLLGVNGVVIIAHGRSDSLAIANAIKVAIDAADKNLVETIRQDMADAVTVLEGPSGALAGTTSRSTDLGGAPST
ncbi:MAG TPA: phosphate acyltransferase PlsX [Chloroflexi bacterium]|jgi:glycerol-3-phosphate acyltransferase PlsX|nr:phosphate acyltransferase PlsX [Chloroflexota bacterium]